MNSKRQEEADGVARYVWERLEGPLKMAFRNATKCCPNCEHFAPDPITKCNLNGLKPPSTIIAFGCECFKDNDCPF